MSEKEQMSFEREYRDLLEACKHVHKFLTVIAGTLRFRKNKYLLDCIETLDAAIAKAEGDK